MSTITAGISNDDRIRIITVNDSFVAYDENPQSDPACEAALAVLNLTKSKSESDLRDRT